MKPLKSKPIEDLIVLLEESLADKLKPSIKDKVQFVFSDEIIKQGGGIVRATCNSNFKPAIITLYTKAIAQSYLDYINRDLKELITHELTHLFVKDEAETNKECVKLNFFENE